MILPLGGISKWVELDNQGKPNNPIKDRLSQPTTIKVTWSSRNGHEIPQELTPEKGLFGPEYALMYTIPDYKLQLLEHLNNDKANDKDYIHKKFNLFQRCLQRVAIAKWDK